MMKSARRLAMEIVGKDQRDAELHLVKFGASVPGAAAAVAMHVRAVSRTVDGPIGEIERSIEENC